MHPYEVKIQSLNRSTRMFQYLSQKYSCTGLRRSKLTINVKDNNENLQRSEDIRIEHFERNHISM